MSEDRMNAEAPFIDIDMQTKDKSLYEVADKIVNILELIVQNKINVKGLSFCFEETPSNIPPNYPPFMPQWNNQQGAEKGSMPPMYQMKYPDMSPAVSKQKVSDNFKSSRIQFSIHEISAPKT